MLGPKKQNEVVNIWVSKNKTKGRFLLEILVLESSTFSWH